MTNKWNTVIYVGVTNSIERRYFEHTLQTKHSFTKKYNINKLVYVEDHQGIEDAIAREKQIKNYSRARKNKLIITLNPLWNDLAVD